MNRLLLVLLLGASLLAAATVTDTLRFKFPASAVKTVNVKTIVGDVEMVPGDSGADVELVGVVTSSDESEQRARAMLALCECSPGLTQEGELVLRADGPDSGDCRVDVTVTLPRPVPVKATCANGDVEATGLACPLRLTTIYGNITVLEHRGPVRADASNGEIECRVERLGAGDSLELDCIRGGIYVMVPPGVDATFDAYTTSGRIDFNYLKFDCDEREQDKAKGRLGTGLAGWGPAHIAASTIMGDIRFYGSP